MDELITFSKLSGFAHELQHDCQALLKAKYCPLVAAVSCTQKQNKKKRVTLTFDLDI